MSSNRRRSTNPSRRPISTNPPKEKYKWSYIQEKTLIQLFDEAIAMNNYTLKHPSTIGRDYMVENFNQAFNMNITYGFFKNKLDEFKKSYKRWKVLMHKTGITVDPYTSMIYASDKWWNDQVFGCKLTKSFNRKPPEFWDVVQRCLVLYDVQSQSQHFFRQRREQLINEHAVDEVDHDDSLIVMMCHKHKFLKRKKKKTREVNNEVTNICDQPLDVGVVHKDLGGSARVSIGSGSRGNRRRQSFETIIQDTIAGYREFQRQSVQQLRPAILTALDLPKHPRFYWACINTLKELVFWRKYFIDIAASTDGDKLQLLEAMTGVSQNNQDVPKQLGSSHSFGSPHLGGLSSGSPSSVTNNLGGQNSLGCWGPIYQQRGTPPNDPHWSTPPNAPQWGTPPNSQTWQQTHNFQQGVSSRTTPTNVQYGFSLGSEGETMRNTQHEPSGGATIETSSSGLGFTNYFETGQLPQIPRLGGLFNIWGTKQGPNASHPSDVGD
ncbi:hypothetical protein CARUB_v10007567mg [Capsella rubella]|uniref:Myb/SANT-like domain-containing protein n=1 Tax=Capsella rubella TaxID=81985 RepID=R0H5W3_9BRAS|nr:hypothetical protein CARUB_v10007567mg [Capsella rubella]